MVFFGFLYTLLVVLAGFLIISVGLWIVCNVDLSRFSTLVSRLRTSKPIAPRIVDLNNCPRAVKIGTIENGELVLSQDELKKIICQSDVADLPITVISVAGIKRSGKSVLMSLFIRELQEGLRDGEQLFKYSDEEDTCTQGIWAWSKLLVSNKYGNNNQPTAILLLDTQGTGDEIDGTAEAVRRMIFFCALTSSTLIYNVDKVIKTDSRDELVACAETAKSLRRAFNREQILFQDLTVLVRNFEFKPPADVSRYGFERGASYSQKNVAEVVRQNFQNVACCVLPYPGDAIQSFNGKLDNCNLKSEFVREMKLFLQTVLTNVSPVISPNAKVLTCKQWFEMALNYAHALKLPPQTTLPTTTQSSSNAVAVAVVERSAQEANPSAACSSIMTMTAAAVVKPEKQYDENNKQNYEYHEEQRRRRQRQQQQENVNDIFNDLWEWGKKSAEQVRDFAKENPEVNTLASAALGAAAHAIASKKPNLLKDVMRTAAGIHTAIHTADSLIAAMQPTKKKKKNRANNSFY